MSGSMQGKLFLILGPSGSGKGVTIAHLRKAFPEAIFPVSCTTRDPRSGEKDGHVYNFISKDEFRCKADAGEFLEWAVVHSDNMYGTLKEPIMKALDEGKIVVREVDMQGVQSIREILSREKVVTIFLTVPDWKTLKGRILRRQDESDEELSQRQESFEKEMEFSHECKYVIESREGGLRRVFSEIDEIIRLEMEKVA
jgi:guanylate kinase